MKRLGTLCALMLMALATAVSLPTSANALTANTWDEELGEATPEEVYLTSQELRSYIKEALRTKFKRSFRVADESESRFDRPRYRCRRTSERSGLCRVGWFLGDVSWQGKVYVKLGVDRGSGIGGSDEIFWNWALRIRFTNHYCLDATFKSLRRCSKLYRVSYG